MASACQPCSSKLRRLLGSRWFWSQAYQPGHLASLVISKSLSLQEPRMAHPTNGANNAKAVGRIKWDEVISVRRLAHPNKSSGHCLSTTASASEDSCKPVAPILQIPRSWRLDVREAGVLSLSQSSPGWGWEANTGTWCQHSASSTIHLCVSSGLWMCTDRQNGG